MARKFLTPIDLAGFELENAKAHKRSNDPTGLGAGDAGLMWFNTAQNRWKYWDGSAAVNKATDSDLLGGQDGAYYRDRAHHTGTQTAATISDLASTVQAYSLSTFTAPTGDLSLASHKLINVTDPVGNQDAATKNYVDGQLAGLASGQVLKGSVRAAATSNVSVASAPVTVDGITPTSGDVFLLTGQTTGAQNGPYVWTAAGSAMTRASNWDSSTEAVLGSYWIVREGSNADVFALLTNDTPVTLGTTTPTFVFRGSAGATYTAGDGLSLAGTEFNIGAGLGITVAADTVAVDTTVVARKVTGVVPAASSGMFTVSGATVTVNHALGNAAALLSVRYGSSPGTGTVGAQLDVDNTASDDNNIVITFPAAPSANQYVVTVIG